MINLNLNFPLCVSVFTGVERTLQSLKPHQEGLLLPLIQEHRKLSHSMEGSMKEKEDGHVAFIATLVARYAELSDETITAVAIVGDSKPARMIFLHLSLRTFKSEL